MPTPEHPDFGMDREEHYGTITYYNEHNEYVEEKVPTVTGDYSRMYDAIFETIRSHKPQLVTPEQTLLQLKLLEEGIGQCE